MRFSERYKREAIELYEEYTMNEVFQQLMKSFPNKHHPNEKTIRRWKDEAKMLENQTSESVETPKKPTRERLITDDALYEKIMDLPEWAKKRTK